MKLKIKIKEGAAISLISLIAALLIKRNKRLSKKACTLVQTILFVISGLSAAFFIDCNLKPIKKKAKQEQDISIEEMSILKDSEVD